MTEVLRVDQNEEGRYVVFMGGREFALASQPIFDAEYDYVRGIYGGHAHVGTRFQIKLDCYELPAPPPPKPKRTWSSAMGLRKATR